MLTRDQILSADDLKRETVAVPEWGGDVIVRTMTGTERDAFEASLQGGKGGKLNLANIRARLVSRTAVDDAGARLFTEADIEAVGGKSAAALDRCFAVAQRLNGLSAKDVEDLGKNS